MNPFAPEHPVLRTSLACLLAVGPWSAVEAASAPAAVRPTAPAIASATPGANSVRLDVTPPSSPGSSAVVLYTATCTDGSFKFVGSAPASPVIVSGLTQLVNYQCSVSATNRQLNGPESSAVAVTLPGATPFAVLASAPQGVTVTPGDGRLTLQFQPPASNGGYAVVGYRASCSGGVGLGGSAVRSPIVVNGLKNGASYSCTVAAVNTQGTGADSPAVTAIPVAGAPGGTAPGSPSNVQAVTGNGMATIRFTAPAVNGGAPITSYSATCNAGGLSVSGSALNSPIQVLGLSNGSFYTCSVFATNLYGNSAGATTTVTPSANVVNSAAAPASVAVAATVPSLAADGLSAVVAQLRTANGALYAGPDVMVYFGSRCADSGLARMEVSAVAHDGVAAVTYQPNGCVGVDSLTATVAGSGIKGVASVVVSDVAALSPKATLGKAMFFDKTLSASGTLACASCHAPSQHYLSPNQSMTPLGGVDGKAVGFRSAPSAAYAALTRAFRFLTGDNKQGTGSIAKAGSPTAGQMWDGRIVDISTQASGPFLAPHEMANASSTTLRNKLLTRPYLAQFNAIYGMVTAASNADTVMANMANAIGQYETEDRSFMPFNSKFDAVQVGAASFTDQEANGQLLFFDSAKGACGGCHTPFSQARVAQSPSMFTDHDYRAIGVPRNWMLPYNNDALVNAAVNNLKLGSLLNGGGLGAPSHTYYDMGFCGPFRTDSQSDTAMCGVFRTPGLRNVVLKGSYFHNGVFGDLNQVLAFYMNRDANPQFIYRKADGQPDVRFNDLPIQYQGNVAVRPPFTPLPGGRLTPAEAQDLITYLCTFTDGFDPRNPGAYRQSKQCSNAVRR